MPKQPELNGFERPKIDVIEERIASWQEAKEEHESWKTTRDDRHAELLSCMKEHEAELECNADGNPVYHYQDGEEYLAVALVHQDRLSVKKQAPPKDEAEIG